MGYSFVTAYRKYQIHIIRGIYKTSGNCNFIFFNYEGRQKAPLHKFFLIEGDTINQ